MIANAPPDGGYYPAETFDPPADHQNERPGEPPAQPGGIDSDGGGNAKPGPDAPAAAEEAPGDPAAPAAGVDSDLDEDDAD
jgi:hypothetical protein